jgi:hypothetical protein
MSIKPEILFDAQQDHRTPPDELQDINTQLQAIYRPTASDLSAVPLMGMDLKEIHGVVDRIAKAGNAAFLADGGSSDLDLHSQEFIEGAWAEHDRIEKSINLHQTKDQSDREEELGGRGPKGAFIDRMGIWGYDTTGVTERPSPIGWEWLRAIVEQVPVFNACILTRIRQVRRFCAPVEREAEVGFQVVRNHIARKYSKDGAGDLEWRRWFGQFFKNGGDVFDAVGRKKLGRETLPTSVAKMIRQTYQYDAMSLQTERNGKGQCLGYYVMDGHTIRLIYDNKAEYFDEKGRRVYMEDRPFAVQVIQQTPVEVFTYDQLIYEPRNPRADVRLAGYGYPETEMLVRAATGYLNALLMNIRGQDENRIPPGLLLLFGDYGKEALQHFQIQWQSLLRGVNRRWMMPLLAAKNKDAGAQFVKFNADFNEMYFSKWMTFLTALICAIMGMDPTEINFESFSAARSPLSGSDTAEKLASSKDKGLEPLLAYLAGIFTDWIIASYDPDYSFRWRGLHPEEMEVRKAAIEKVGTINEYRELEGYDPIPKELGWGELPVNPVHAQYVAPVTEALKPPEPEQPEGAEGEGMPIEEGADQADMENDEAERIMKMNTGTPPNHDKQLSEEDVEAMRGGAAARPGAKAEKPAKEKEMRKAYVMEVIG